MEEIGVDNMNELGNLPWIFRYAQLHMQSIQIHEHSQKFIEMHINKSFAGRVWWSSKEGLIDDNNNNKNSQ